MTQCSTVYDFNQEEGFPAAIQKQTQMDTSVLMGSLFQLKSEIF
jgi:hypothetical protein